MPFTRHIVNDHSLFIFLLNHVIIKKNTLQSLRLHDTSEIIMLVLKFVNFVPKVHGKCYQSLSIYERLTLHRHGWLREIRWQMQSIYIFFSDCIQNLLDMSQLWSSLIIIPVKQQLVSISWGRSLAYKGGAGEGAGSSGAGRHISTGTGYLNLLGQHTSLKL